MKKILLAAVLSSSLLSGCASIVSDSTYPVAINSSPSNAYFVVKNKKGIEINSGTTPTTLVLESGAGFFSAASYTIVMKKEGYTEQVVEIKATLDGWYIGNILFGGIIGLLIVDPATGAMWKLPEVQYISLGNKGTAELSSGELNIVSIDSISQDDRSNLIRVN